MFKVIRKSDNQVFAAKVYFKEIFDMNPHKDKFMNMVKNEYHCLKLMSHPGILSVFEMFQMVEKIILIMEFVEGGDLY